MKKSSTTRPPRRVPSSPKAARVQAPGRGDSTTGPSQHAAATRLFAELVGDGWSFTGLAEFRETASSPSIDAAFAVLSALGGTKSTTPVLEPGSQRARNRHAALEPGPIQHPGVVVSALHRTDRAIDRDLDALHTLTTNRIGVLMWSRSVATDERVNAALQQLGHVTHIAWLGSSLNLEEADERNADEPVLVIVVPPAEARETMLLALPRDDHPVFSDDVITQPVFLADGPWSRLRYSTAYARVRDALARVGDVRRLGDVAEVRRVMPRDDSWRPTRDRISGARSEHVAVLGSQAILRRDLSQADGFRTLSETPPNSLLRAGSILVAQALGRRRRLEAAAIAVLPEHLPAISVPNPWVAEFHDPLEDMQVAFIADLLSSHTGALLLAATNGGHGLVRPAFAEVVIVGPRDIDFARIVLAGLDAQLADRDVSTEAAARR